MTQIETLIVLRTTAPQDRAKIEEWVEEHEIGKEAVATLSSLEDGEGWVWSPHFLKTMKRVRFRRRETFDSGKTPELDEEDLPPATLADINLDEIRKVMADTIEKAKAEDPKELQRQVADLKRQIKTGQAMDPSVIQKARQEGKVDGYKEALAEVAKKAKAVHTAITNLQATADDLERAAAYDESKVSAPQPAVPRSTKITIKPKPWVGFDKETTNTNLEKAQAYILTALAQYGTARDGKQLALLSGYRYNRHMRNNLSALRTAGYITGDNLTPIDITDAGRKVLGKFPLRLASPSDLAAHWMAQFDKQPRAILHCLLQYPHGTDHKNLCEQTGYTYNRHFRNSLSDLRSAGVLIGPNMGTMRPAPELV